MDNRFKLLCRVCLVDSASYMRSLDEERTREMLYECTSVWVDPGDKYPQQMCAKCWNRCRDWADFKSLAQDSDGQLKAEEKDFPGSMSDEVIVKEEQVVYLEGYSLAPEEVEEEDDGEPQLSLENEVLCNDGDDNVLIELRLKIEEEDEMMTEAEVELEKGNMLMGEGDKEEQFDYAHDKDEKEQDAIEPPVGDAVTDGSEEKKTPSNVKGRKLKCRYCTKGFPRLSLLKIHERVHTNERPFPCDECEQKFKTNGHLTQHKWIHSGGKEFKCDECDKKCTRKGNLMKHKLIHLGIKTFKCDQCHKKFTQKSAMISHKRSHSNKRPFKCNMCVNRFKHKHDLSRHLKKLHP